MLSSRWPRSPSHGKCSRRFCGSSRNYGRSHHQRQRETFDVMHSRATDRRSASKCQGKWPDQTLDQAFGLAEVLVAVSTSGLSCKGTGKTRTLMPVWDGPSNSGGQRMGTFYDEWLAAGERIQEEFRRSPMIAHDRKIPWIKTRQDAKVKLMVANELGFPTMGNCVLKAEIPVGWHTGKHVHGEESIHILSGRGFSLINGQRFDWHAGSTMQIPYRAEHQHFNTGNEPAQYLSAMCLPLELFVKLGSVEQIEDCGPNDPAVLRGIPEQSSQYLKDGRRAIIHLEDAPTDWSYHPLKHLPAVQQQHDTVRYLAVPANGFQ